MLRYKSAVWRYFSVSSDETKAMCHLCGKLLSRGGCGKSASTSPLSAHLKSMHRKEYDAREDVSKDAEGCTGVKRDNNKMPDRCCIPDCGAYSNKVHGKVSLFRIPKDEAARARWLKSIPLKNWKPAQRAVVCERHFEPSCISKRESYIDKFGTKKMFTRTRPALVSGALPTVFGGVDTAPPNAVRKRRKRRKLLEKRRKRNKKENKKKDSMPLQQRLNTIATNSSAAQEENKPPPLKSQPLSPTKLKVTRQSTTKTTQEAVASPGDTSNEEVCLRWNSHHSNMQSAFPSLLSKEQYCDVTLVADGKSLKCHKLILSSCSSYFDQVLEKIMPYQHPVIFMKDIPFNILKSLCDFMYAGEVNILQSDLDQLLAVAESLKIKGLANKHTSNTSEPSPQKSKDSVDQHQQQPIKEAQSRFIKIAPKPTPSGVTDGKKSSTPKGGANGDVTDPLDLMEPTYEEEATVDVPPPVVPRRGDQARRSLGKRVRKRKHIGNEEHESSPPVFQSRKGTRSRPNVKVPRYFNASFDNSNDKPPTSEASELQQEAGVDACADPLLDLLEEIKTEPVDIEDSLIEESYDAGRTRLAVVVAKQEKEDAPDPLNVEAVDGRQHQHVEEASRETSSNVAENSDTVEGNDTEPVDKVSPENTTIENLAELEQNGQVVLNIAETFSAADNLPENVTS